MKATLVDIQRYADKKQYRQLTAARVRRLTAVQLREAYTDGYVIVAGTLYHYNRFSLAREFTKATGRYFGARGGWIYRTSNSTPICQGWREFANLFGMDIFAWLRTLVRPD